VRDFLEITYYGNPVSAWLTALAVLLGGFALLTVVKKLLVRRVGRFAARTATRLDDLALVLLERTRPYFLFFVALAGALVLLQLGTWRTALRQLSVVVLLLQMAVWGNATITFWLARITATRREGEHADLGSVTTLNALGVLARVVVWIVIFLLALQNFGVNITALITGLGIAGIAVALAVQNILGDVLASLSIVIDKPFVIGDYIVVDAYEGTVENVGLRTTRIKSLSGEQIIFANAELLKARIRNHKGMIERRAAFTIGLQYDTPAEKVELVPQIIRELITSIPQARLDRTHFRSFGDSALNVETVYFVLVPDYNVFMDIQQQINLTLLRRFAAEGIEFAFPTRTVVIKGDLPEAHKPPPPAPAIVTS
jgi:small-conductance mechanosensitive channel